MEDNKTLWWILTAIILTVVGFALIPPLIKRYSSKLYREINKREKIKEIFKKNIKFTFLFF